MAPQLYRRIFSRTVTPDDQDVLADDAFIRANFVDVFGALLADGTLSSMFTYQEMAPWFYGSKDFKMATYVVSDAAYIPAANVSDTWFSNHVRFLSVVTPNVQNKGGSTSRVFVVGSLPKKGTGFLQVGSWDGKVMRFYAVENKDNGNDTPRVWTYQGNSWDAFGEGQSVDNEYLGPFNGHVNGGTIMKEIHAPWYHWYAQSGNFIKCLTDDQLARFKATPFLTAPGSPCFVGATVATPDVLERTITDIVNTWYLNRVQRDFYIDHESGNHKLLVQPTNIQRWAAHLLLTTTVNFATAKTANGQDFKIDPNHFLNMEMLSGYDAGLLPSNVGDYDLPFTLQDYGTARDQLGLSLLQEVQDDATVLPPSPPWETKEIKKGLLGGGRQTGAYDLSKFTTIAKNFEGIPFVILQPSVEDSIGVLRFQSVRFPKGVADGVFTQKAFRAITMLDFCNPVFSWRRGVLMQYIPQSTNLDPTGNLDLEAGFVSAVRASSHVADKDSPEYQFLQLYDNDPGNTDAYQRQILLYLASIQRRLTKSTGAVAALVEYLSLAESRRRIYRPLPLDEFGVQLPYALNLEPNWPLIEMTPKGTTQPIPERGVKFLVSWTTTLASFDPHLIPAKETSSLANALTAEENEDQSPVRMATGIAKCPVMSSRMQSKVSTSLSVPEATMTSQSPTWDEDVRDLFAKPSWVADPAGVGQNWRDAMLYYSPPKDQSLHLDFADRSSVQANAITIYEHLRSKSMPITSDSSEYWPEWALETLRLWANQGFRSTSSDPIQESQVIPAPVDPPFTMRVRKDILSLTDAELQTYREKLDTILRVGELTEPDGKTPSKWQEIGLLHAEWCLHYQEATFFWHRGYLRYVEELIDFPIPYWNGFAADTSKVDSPTAGLPSIFLEDTYTNSAGEVRKNPLKWALSFNSKNKSGSGAYVERYAALTDGKKGADWVRKVQLFDKYHKQIALALAQPIYSYPEGDAVPWANLPAFQDDQPDNLYPQTYKSMYFDGLFEQAHDNYHGWVGPDMADNTYTAFDPIFLSYHANMDRVVNGYLKKVPPTSLTTNFPLRPFTALATKLSYTDPREYTYSTIGDMAKDTKALNYLYAPPANPDFVPLPVNRTKPQTKGGQPVPAVSRSLLAKSDLAVNATASEPNPYIVFTGVACIKDSYEIDVFVKDSQSLDPNPVSNPSYIGRVTRVGMGSGRDPTQPIKNAGRCSKAAVTRILEVDSAKEALVKQRAIVQVVRDLTTGQEVGEEEWSKWPGFQGRLVWG